MPPINTRKEFATPSAKGKASQPLRRIRPASSKIIFLSMEGISTEEEYFKLLQELYPAVTSKIKLISIQEEVLSKPRNERTTDEKSDLGKTEPYQLVEKMTKFKEEKEEQYRFSEYPEDEFWIVMDVDKHWENKKRWNDAIQSCKDKGYSYAVSNPFFEMWLLLHHRDPNHEDEQYAVTDVHPYETTSYYLEQLRLIGAVLRDQKHIRRIDYTQEKVVNAVERARRLHKDASDLKPAYYATTVYLLVDKILSLNNAMEKQME